MYFLQQQQQPHFNIDSSQVLLSGLERKKKGQKVLKYTLNPLAYNYLNSNGNLGSLFINTFEN